MRRRPTTRLAALWIALFFLLSQGSDALGLHSCPLHSSPEHQAAMGADAGVHAAHMAGAAQHGSQQDDDARAPCTCVGACCASAGSSSVPQPGVSWRPLLAVATVASLDATRSVALLRPPYLFPYAQAPPRVG